MIGLEVNDAIILEQQKVLEAALSTNPKTQKALQKLIRQVLMQARKELSGYIKTKLKNGDPRGAARAVRTSVYRKILGGNLNFLRARKRTVSTPTNHHGHCALVSVAETAVQGQKGLIQ